MLRHIAPFVGSMVFVTAAGSTDRFLIQAGCIFFAFFVELATSPIIKRERAARRYLFTPFVRALYYGLFINYPIIVELIVHFGLPPTLTFGHQVGKIIPPTCEGSRLIEGPDGCPCTLLRLREWTVAYLRGQRAYDIEESPLMWGAIWVCLVLEFCFVVVLPIVLTYVESREQSREAVMVDIEKGENRQPVKGGKRFNIEKGKKLVEV